MATATADLHPLHQVARRGRSRALARRRDPHLQPGVPERVGCAQRALCRRLRVARQAVEEEAHGGQGRLADWPRHHGAGTTAKSLRTFKEGKAYENDPNLGTDPQPKHLKNKYTGSGGPGRRPHQLGHPESRVLPSGDRARRLRVGEGRKIWYSTLLALTRPATSTTWSK